jgi:hypothetical protein
VGIWVFLYVVGIIESLMQARTVVLIYFVFPPMSILQFGKAHVLALYCDNPLSLSLVLVAEFGYTYESV